MTNLVYAAEVIGLLYLLAGAAAGFEWLRRRTLTEPGESYELQAPTEAGGREWEPAGDPGLSPGSLSAPIDWEREGWAA